MIKSKVEGNPKVTHAWYQHLIIKVNGLHRGAAKRSLLGGADVTELGVSDDIAPLNPAPPSIEPSTVCHLIAKSREIVVLKETIITCRIIVCVTCSQCTSW